MDSKKASVSIADGKVPIRKKIAYGVGEFADACVYKVFYSYFLFFLTDVAHIHPAFAVQEFRDVLLFWGFTSFNNEYPSLSMICSPR
ncbi:MAG: hypothetical protein JSW26_26335 [Desulfobacterales bacterium]|nr:MAG: hypothetical protein JSW26_26335 [Desulfobacterales bacterium]